MENIEHSTLESEFVNTLVAAVNEVRGFTRIGVSKILDQIRTKGGLEVAKQSLRPRSSGRPPLFPHLDRYPFLSAAKRVGRPDLSLEFLALQPNWSPLFTAEELEVARKRLRKFDVNPGRLEDYLPPIPRIVTALASSKPPLSLPDHAWSGADRSEREMSPCEVTVKLAAEVEAGRSALALPAVRQHLQECGSCKRQHAKLIEVYRQTDEHSFWIWKELTKQFEQSLRLEYKDYEHLIREPREADTAEDDSSEYDDEYEYLAELDFDRSIRPLLAWRALRLGIHLGRFMQRIANSFAVDRDQWVIWRRPDPDCEASAAVSSLSHQQFLYAIMATYLPLMRHWPEEEDDLLWLPTVNDPGNASVPNLFSVEPVLKVEDVTLDETLDEWEEILGVPPHDLAPANLLFVAHQAARSDVGSLQPSLHVSPIGSSDLSEVLAEIVRNQKKQLELTSQILDRQDILISESNRIVAHMGSTDRHAAEQALISTLGEIYGRLDPQARSNLVAATQMSNVPGLASPAMIVAAVAAAFEIQLKASVVIDLIAFLKVKKIPKLKIEKLTLGDMERLLRDPEPAIAEFFGPDPHWKTEIADSIANVKPYRNEAVHQGKIDSGVAGSLLDDWLGRGRQSKSIFTVLFPPQF